MEEWRKLDGTVVMITGGSSGLGRALAVAFADAGADVGICARKEAGLVDVAREVRERGRRCVAVPVDVRREEELLVWLHEVERELAGPSVLINNASLLGPRDPLVRHDMDAWREVIDVNLTGTFLASRVLLPPMLRDRRGSIINVSSGAAVLPRSGWGAYAVSKHAVEGLSLNLAAELEGSGVRVNIVDPGAMRTPMRAAAYPDEDPGTVNPPGAATGVFLWLASDAARDVTGKRFRAQAWSAAHPGADDAERTLPGSSG
jgi:NAD(P)-dependent dehydrogenase (short-subunit alcohol dehydrogenase family)